MVIEQNSFYRVIEFGNERLVYVRYISDSGNVNVKFLDSFTNESINDDITEFVEKVEFEDIKEEYINNILNALYLKSNVEYNREKILEALTDELLIQRANDLFKLPYEKENDDFELNVKQYPKWVNFEDNEFTSFYHRLLDKFNLYRLPVNESVKATNQFLSLDHLLIEEELKNAIHSESTNVSSLITTYLNLHKNLYFSKGNLVEVVMVDDKPLIQFLPKDKPIKLRPDGSLYYTQTTTIGKFMRDVFKNFPIDENQLRKFAEKVEGHFVPREVVKWEEPISKYMNESLFEKDWSTQSCMVGKDRERFSLYDHLQEKGILEMYLIKRKDLIVGRFFKWNVQEFNLDDYEHKPFSYCEKLYYDREGDYLFFEKWVEENKLNRKYYNSCGEEFDFWVYNEETGSYERRDLEIFFHSTDYNLKEEFGWERSDYCYIDTMNKLSEYFITNSYKTQERLFGDGYDSDDVLELKFC